MSNFFCFVFLSITHLLTDNREVEVLKYQESIKDNKQYLNIIIFYITLYKAFVIFISKTILYFQVCTLIICFPQIHFAQSDLLL